jgi:hypothetical protein
VSTIFTYFHIYKAIYIFPKRLGDNFARCLVCDRIQTHRRIQHPGSQIALMWQQRLNVHLDLAWAHRELYYSNRYRSQILPDECVTIMHDKMDHSKTASLVLLHETKHLDGLTKLPISVTGILAHRHDVVKRLVTCCKMIDE